MRRTVLLGIVTDNDADFAQAYETAGRLAAGLIIDGMTVNLITGVPDEDDDAS